MNIKKILLCGLLGFAFMSCLAGQGMALEKGPLEESSHLPLLQSVNNA